jgi:hypothetical protein
MASRTKRIMRSPTFPSIDRKDLWVERTRDLALNDFERAVIEGEINAMTDEEVTAALASSVEREDVQDPPDEPSVKGPKTVTVTDDNSNEEEEDEGKRKSRTLPADHLGYPNRSTSRRSMTTTTILRIVTVYLFHRRIHAKGWISQFSRTSHVAR